MPSLNASAPARPRKAGSSSSKRWWRSSSSRSASSAWSPWEEPPSRRSPTRNTAPRRAASPTPSPPRSPSASSAPTKRPRPRRSATFAHQPTPPPTDVPAPCSFGGHAAHGGDGARRLPLLQRAANLTDRARTAGGDRRQPADLHRRRRHLQPRRHHAVLEDRERQRVASPHARDLRQLRTTCARAPSGPSPSTLFARSVADRNPGRRRHRADRRRRHLPGGRGLDQAHAVDQFRRRCASRRHAGALQHRTRPQAGRPWIRQGGARR